MIIKTGGLKPEIVLSSKNVFIVDDAGSTWQLIDDRHGHGLTLQLVSSDDAALVSLVVQPRASNSIGVSPTPRSI